MSNPRVGFIGIGMMGHGMAKNLLAKGYPAVVSRAPRPLAHRRPRGRGREGGGHARRARAASDVVILCVTGSPQVEQNVFGEKGLLGAARSGLTVIDTSTAEPGSTAKCREALAAKGATFVDAPLARTPKEAEEGRLNTMVGADDADLRAREAGARRLLREHLPRRPSGRGHTLKLVNNFMALTIVASIAEAFAVAAKAGVKLDKLHEVVSQGAINSPIFQMMGGGAVAGDLTRMKFSIVNAAKDLRYYTHLAESLPIRASSARRSTNRSSRPWPWASATGWCPR
jgi:3-hydroxyisobutyrate dehydrogenase-like beta-hydroxyacid dehydrogenase